MVMVVLEGVALVANKEAIYVLLSLVPVTLLIRFCHCGMFVVICVLLVPLLPLRTPSFRSEVPRKDVRRRQGETSSGQGCATDRPTLHPFGVSQGGQSGGKHPAVKGVKPMFTH